MSTEFGFSPNECKVIRHQIERRQKLRDEFLKLRTDPCKHSMESGYVFDEAVQRFMSMKVTQLQYFVPGIKTGIKGITLVVIPMFLYGGLVYWQRTNFLNACSSGKIKYRDRIHKLT